MVTGLPSLITRAEWADIFMSSSMAFSARNSCTKPMTAFRTTITMMAYGIRGLADDAGDDGGGNQHQDHEVLELVQEHHEHRFFGTFGQFVGTMLQQPFPDFVRGKAPGRRPQFLHGFICFLLMPVHSFPLAVQVALIPVLRSLAGCFLFLLEIRSHVFIYSERSRDCLYWVNRMRTCGAAEKPSAQSVTLCTSAIYGNSR